MCIYPMNSPGGYQLIGRTLPIWNMFTRTGPFESGKPWLLRNFDRIKYYEVSEEELNGQRKNFRNGQMEINIEESHFSLEEYNAMVDSVAAEVAILKERQRIAMEKQMAIDAMQLTLIDESKHNQGEGNDETDFFGGKESSTIRSQVTGTVWELKVNTGDDVKIGDTIMVLEAMKMEYAVHAANSGKVTHIGVTVGEMVQQGAPLCLIE